MVTNTNSAQNIIPTLVIKVEAYFYFKMKYMYHY